MSRKIRYGMIGGGRGAFIGGVHRIAASIDQQIELVCGAFSSDPQRSKDSGADFFLPAERCYANYEEMIRTESALPADKRMDFVSIVTPNHLHFPAAKAASPSANFSSAVTTAFSRASIDVLPRVAKISELKI